MNIRLIAAIVTASLATPLYAADTYTIDPNHTLPSWEVMHLDYSLQRGRFEKTSGKIELDRAAKSGSVEIQIDTASLSTGIEKLNTHLRNEDFFDVARYPNITFKSNALTWNHDKIVAVSGDLTIRGITKPVTLTVSRFNCGPHPMVKKEACGADAYTFIKRSDFDMKYALPAVADKVKLVLNVEALKD